jgi:NAD(P)-dependent dehydrogenase (short-subunit alcohol dehydrogenase family)
MKRFEDKTILVTGAGSGIGAACVRRLFAEGAAIVAADVRKEEVDKVVSEFGNSERIYGVGVDVSDRDQVAALVSAPAAESRACSAPSASRRAISRRPARSYGCADGGSLSSPSCGAQRWRRCKRRGAWDRRRS